MAVIANMDIVLGARTGKLDAGFAQATKSTSELESNLGSIGAVGDAAFGQIGDMLQPLLGSIPGLSAGLAVVKAGLSAVEKASPGKAMEMATTAAETQRAAKGMREYAQASASAAAMKPGLTAGSLPPKADMPIGAKMVAPPIVPPQVAGATSALGGLSAAGVAAGAAIGAAFVAAAAGAVAAGVAIQGVREQMTAIDDVSDAAKKLGVTFEDLATLRFGLGMSSGLDEGAIDASLQRMQLGLAEAKSGSGELASVLKALGLDAGQLIQAGPVEALKQISVATQQLKSPTDQLQVAYQLFGKQGAALVSSLRDGPDAINEAATAARNLGLTLSQAQAEQVGAANDAWEQVYLIADGVFRQIAAEVAPVLQVIGEEILAVAGNFGSVAGVLPEIVDGTVTFVGYLYDAYEAATLLGTTLGNIMNMRWDEIGKDIEAGLTFDTADNMLSKIREAREAAKAASEGPATGEIDILAIERQNEAIRKASEDAMRSEQARMDAAKRAQESINNRIQSLRDEVDVLRLGEQAARSMQLARAGASPSQVAEIQQLEQQKDAMREYQDMLKRGTALKEQFASPMDKLRDQVAELQKLRDAGAIDPRTFDMAAMDAAKNTLKLEAPKQPPPVAALERGSVEAFSAVRQAEKDAQALKTQENLSRQQVSILERILAELSGSSQLATVGA